MTSCQSHLLQNWTGIGSILKQMWILGSGGVQEQGACEYWGNGRAARVTEIYKLPLDQKEQSATQEAQL